jgi:hypothetical protein
MELKDIIVSAFSHVMVKDNPAHLPLMEILESIRKGTPEIKRRIGAIRKEKDKQKRSELKVRLLAVFTPSGIFRRMEDNEFLQSSGAICIDLDHIQNLEAEKKRLKTIPYVFCIFKSPSGDGLKVFIQHDLSDHSRHKDLYSYLGDQLGVRGRTDLVFDMNCSNISHSCFWSYDPELWLNKEAQVFHIDLDTLPVYKPQNNSKGTGKQNQNTVNTPVVLLASPKEIKDKILESHTLFEEYYSMYPGVRNQNLYILANFFLNDGIPEDFAADYLVAYYADPKNGFTASEIRGIVKSAYH